MNAIYSQRLRGGVLSLVSLGVLVAGLALISEPVRDMLVRVVHGDMQVNAVLPALRLQHTLKTVTNTVGREHAELAGFAAAAGVLVAVMLRT